MKKRFTGIMMMVIFLASAGTLWADLGLSFQAMGGYVLDRGKTEDSLRGGSDAFVNSIIAPDSFDNFINMYTVDCSLSVEYNFWRTFFIRSGCDFATTVGDVETRGENSVTGDNYTINHSYQYIGIPIILGINVPVNRGRYNIYSGLGPCYNLVFINREGKGTDTAIDYTEKSEFEAEGVGFVAVAGIGVKLFKDISINIEMTYRDFSKDRTKRIEPEDSAGFAPATYKQNYVFSAPKTSIRFGVRYSL